MGSHPDNQVSTLRRVVLNKVLWTVIGLGALAGKECGVRQLYQLFAMIERPQIPILCMSSIPCVTAW
jgi:hypothetical protein